MPYCPDCGSEVGEEANFCPECGGNLSREQKPKAEAMKSTKSKSDESITDVIPNMSTGLLGRHSYSVIVTSKRLIFAKYSSELVKQEQEKARGEKEDEGFFSKWKKSISAGFSFHERYYDMDPQDILGESEDNYEIRPEEIKSVKVKSGRWDPDYGSSSSNEMEIKWTGGKDKFKFDNMSAKEVKKTLTSLLGKKLH